MASLVFLGSMFLIGLVFASLVTVNATWSDEDEGDYLRHRQHSAKGAHAEPESLGARDSAKGRERLSSVLTERAPSSQEGAKAKFRSEEPFKPDRPPEERVGGLMRPTSYYCFEFQPWRVARIMMRENHLQALPVVDFGRRVVGTITMRDIAAFQHKLAK